MDSHVPLPGMRDLKFTLVAGLTLLTADALFAQSAGQSDLDALKARMELVAVLSGHITSARRALW